MRNYNESKMNADILINASHFSTKKNVIYLFKHPRHDQYIATIECNDKILSECMLEYGVYKLRPSFVSKNWDK